MIYISSDHTGIQLKEFIVNLLKIKNLAVDDLGPDSSERVHYTDFAKKLCPKVLENKDNKGILICGTGIGMSMMSNRYKGIRSALCTNEYMAKMARLHNNANVLCLGSRVIGTDLAQAIVIEFVEGSFEGGRHKYRVNQLDS